MGAQGETSPSQISRQARNDTEFSSGRPQKNFAYAFLNASVLFCVGAMAIVGSFKAGIEHDYSIIFLKSILDGFVSIGFAVAMGVGTAFSIIAIFVYQGALTLLSVLIAPFVSEQMIGELTGSGGALIILIGINLMGLKKVKTANYLPAVLFSVIFVLCEPVVNPIFSDAVKSILRIDTKQFDDMVVHDGGAAIKEKLNAVNIQQELKDEEFHYILTIQQL